MPLLNVSSVLLDPDFVDALVCVRRKQSLDGHGRMVTVEQRLSFLGVVTALSPSDLDRQADYATMTRSISVVTRFKLQGETTGYQPDRLYWRGDYYVVKHVDPYPQFGDGFYQIEASSDMATDSQYKDSVSAGFQFNRAGNATFLGATQC